MCRLRELEKKDLDTITKWCSDLELVSLMGLSCQTVNFDINSLELESYVGNRGSAIRCVITLEKTDDILGVISLTFIDYINRYAELHIKIKNDVSQEIKIYAIKAMLSHAFYSMDLRRIELVMLENNEDEYIYQKCGFTYEGRKKRGIYKEGTFFDILCYAVLKEEFEEKFSKDLMLLDIPIYCIALCETKREIKEIIEMCDNAFSLPFSCRENSEELIWKFSVSAKFIYAYSHTMMGYAAMYCNDLEKCIAYISLIGVKTEFQNQHIGSALMNACIQIAKSKGMAAVRLEVRKNNEKAICFYKKHGFVKILDRDDKHWILQKELMKGTD